MATRDVIHEAVLQLRADTAQLRTDLAAGRSMFEGSLKGMQTLARSLVPALSIGGLAAFGKSLVDLGDQLSDLSDATGLSIEVLGGIKSVADQNGTSIDAFANGILRAQKNLGGIKSESDPAAQALNRLGLSVEEMVNASPDKFLEKFVAALAKIPNQNERVYISTQLLGRGATELQKPILELAEKGIPKLTEEAARGYKILGDLKDRIVALKNATLNTLAGIISSSAFDPMRDLDQRIATVRQKLAKQQSDNPVIVRERLLSEETLLGLLRERADLEEQLVRIQGLKDQGGEKKVVDTEAVKRATESIEKQIVALKAQEIELTQGADAAQRYLLSQQMLSQLGVKKLPPEVTAGIGSLRDQAASFGATKLSIEQYSEALNQAEKDMDDYQVTGEKLAELQRATGGIFQEQTNELKSMTDALDRIHDQIQAPFRSDTQNQVEAIRASFQRMREELLILWQQANKTGSALGPEILGMLGGLNAAELKSIDLSGKAIRDLDKQFQLAELDAAAFGVSFDLLGTKIGAVQNAMRDLNRIIADGGPAADLARTKLASLKAEFERLESMKKLEDSVGRVFDSIANGIDQTLTGIIQGTQSLGEGLQNMLRNVMLSINQELTKMFIIEPLKEKMMDMLRGLTRSGETKVPGALEQLGSSAGMQALSTATSLQAAGTGLNTAGVGLNTAGVSLSTAAAALSSAAVSLSAAGGGGLDLGGLGGGTGEEIIPDLLTGDTGAGGGGFDLSSLFSGLTEKLSSMMSGLMDMFSSLLSGAGNIFSSLFSSIGSFIMGLFDNGGFVGVDGLPSFAAGGAVPIMAHPGEFVMRRAAVRSIGTGTLSDMNASGKAPRGGGGPNVRVQIIGNITPPRPEMTRDDIIKVFVEDHRRGGQTRQVINRDRGHR